MRKERARRVSLIQPHLHCHVEVAPFALVDSARGSAAQRLEQNELVRLLPPITVIVGDTLDLTHHQSNF